MNAEKSRWRRWLARRSTGQRIGLLIVALPVLLVLWRAGQQFYYDQKVRWLCNNNDLVKVYETVKLPAERFDQYGNVKIPAKKDAMPWDEYYYISETIYLKKGDPDVRQDNYRVIRRSDEKMLGEYIHYARRGGDVFYVDHPSSFSCLSMGYRPNLEKSVFLKENEK